MHFWVSSYAIPFIEHNFKQCTYHSFLLLIEKTLRSIPQIYKQIYREISVFQCFYETRVKHQTPMNADPQSTAIVSHKTLYKTILLIVYYCYHC
jgi:hypothetical protein